MSFEVSEIQGGEWSGGPSMSPAKHLQPNLRSRSRPIPIPTVPLDLAVEVYGALTAPVEALLVKMVPATTYCDEESFCASLPDALCTQGPLDQACPPHGMA